MEFDEFFAELADIFEIDEERVGLSLSFDEDDVVWDSLAIVSTIALVDQCFGVTLNGQALLECKSVENIVQLISNKVGN